MLPPIEKILHHAEAIAELAYQAAKLRQFIGTYGTVHPNPRCTCAFCRLHYGTDWTTRPKAEKHVVKVFTSWAELIEYMRHPNGTDN